MPWTAAAIIGGAGLSAWASSEGADKASEAQMSAAGGANMLTADMFEKIRADLAPFMGAGKDALPSLLSMLGIQTEGGMNPEAIQAALEKLPGYQFVKQQGLNAVMNQFGAKGLGFSGASAKGVADWTTGLADATWGSQFNRLLDVTRLGQSAAAQTGTFGSEAASQMGQNLLFGGNASAAGILGQYNALSGFGNSMGEMAILNSLMKNQGYTGLYGNKPAAPATGGP